MGSQARYADAERLYSAYERIYRWYEPTGRELSVLNRLYEQGEVWFVQPAGAAPAVLQREPGIPEVYGFRRLEADPSSGWERGMRVGVLEWRVGDSVVAVQPLVVR